MNETIPKSPKVVVSAPDETISVDSIQKIVDSIENLQVETQTENRLHQNKDDVVELGIISDSQKLETFDYDSIALNMVQFQIEYHFSEENLALDNYLLSKLNEDPEHWVSIKIIAGLTKITSITEDLNIVKQAIKNSDKLILNKDETKLKRKDFKPPKPKHHKNIRRTAFVYGLADYNRNNLIKLCTKYGKLKAIVYDNGDKYIFDQQTTENDLETIDRNVSIIIMTKKFGPKAIRSNSSSSFQEVLSPQEQNAWLAGEQQRVSTQQEMINSVRSSNYKPPLSPVFVHPIPNPNGDPLDFSHLKTCFVIFQSQSQANNFVKSRGRANDGIKALHQYEYIKFQKRTSMNKAIGISPLISPQSIGLAVNSTTYAILGSNRNSNNNVTQQQQHNNTQQLSHYNFQQPIQYTQQLTPEQTANQAMEFYLANYQKGTPMLIVPENVADLMAKKFANKLNGNQQYPAHSAPHQQRRHSNNNFYRNQRRAVPHRHTWHAGTNQNYLIDPQTVNNLRKGNRNYNNYQQHPNGQQTWSHKYNQSNDPKYFDFRTKRSSNKKRWSSKSQNRAKTTSNRNMKGHWRNYNNCNGQVPPSPSPNFSGDQNVSDFQPEYHQSPGITPTTLTIAQQ